jgi:hypothetical protein
MTTATLDVIRLDHGQEWIVCSEGCLVEALQEAQATGEYRATCIMDREDLWVCCHCSACGERIAAPCQLCDFELYYENGERCSEWIIWASAWGRAVASCLVTGWAYASAN